MKLFLCLLFSFLSGSIPTAYLVTRKVAGLDIRKHGSGNVGATNAFRVVGKKWGSLVFAADFLKGAIPVWVTLAVFPGTPLLPFSVGIAAILGHIFTPFLGFKGGKGVATGSGVLFGAYPALFLCVLAAWGLLFLITRTVSVSSLFALLTLVISSFWLVQDRRATLLFFILFLLITWSHRSNIFRLLKGEELKFSKKK